MDGLKDDTQKVGVTEEEGRDRVKWRQMILCGNP